MRTKISILLIVVSMLLAACGAKGTFTFQGNITFGSGQTVTLHDGARAVVVEEATFTRDNVEIKLTPGQIIQAKGDVVIDFTQGTILGEFELVAPSTETDIVVPTVTATPEASVPSGHNFVLAHGAHFEDYILDGRDYRELSVTEVYEALKAYGYTDTDLLVIAHSDEVREWQEANLVAGSFDTGKALIAVGEVKNLKDDKAFMLVSPNVYQGPNGIDGNPLVVFDPTPNE